MSSYHIIGSTFDNLTTEVEGKFINKEEYNKFYLAFMQMQNTYCYFGDFDLPIKVSINYDEFGLELRLNFTNWSGYDFEENMEKLRSTLTRENHLHAEGTSYAFEYYNDGQYSVLRFVSDAEVPDDFNIEFSAAHYQKGSGYYFEDLYFSMVKGLPLATEMYRIINEMYHYAYNAFFKSHIKFGYYLSDEGKFLDIVALSPKAN